jgi:hypothetical protein
LDLIRPHRPADIAASACKASVKARSHPDASPPSRRRGDHTTGLGGLEGRRQVAYTVLAAPALRQPAAVVTRVDGTELRTLRLDGRFVVTWRRAGDTCVLSGADVSASELQELAAWTPIGV